MLMQTMPFLIITPSLVYIILTAIYGRKFFSPRNQLAKFTPPVSILKPVKGLDGNSLENFSSFCNQDYPMYQIVFAVASANDPVIPIINELIVAYPEKDISLVVDESIYGANYKVCNLINAYSKAKYQFLIVCDSDIRVTDSYLLHSCAPFANPKIGLVTSLYRSSNVHGTGSAIEALGFCCEMVPNVMAALQVEGLSFALGASIAVRKSALDEIGGFRALVEYLADDYQLGNMVHRAGYDLYLSQYIVESVIKARERLLEVLKRQLRWGRTMRVSRPGGYLASGITLPFPVACLALIISGFSYTGWAAFFILYLIRMLVSLLFSQKYVKDLLLPRWICLIPIRDAISFGIWVMSLFGSKVIWRGHLFRLFKGGKIVEID